MRYLQLSRMQAETQAIEQVWRVIRQRIYQSLAEFDEASSPKKLHPEVT